jgi:predicted acyltransferase
MSTTLTTPSMQQRNVALDVFRGMTVCFMIIVNTPGNDATTFSPLHHAAWNGFTPTDLVFPSFLFAVGNALSFVMKKWTNMSRQQVVWKILKRTAIIFLLGYLMYWFPFFRLGKDHNFAAFPMSNTRIMGVLQRIALCYGIASFLIYFLKVRTSVIICVILLFLYWIILYWFGDASQPLALQSNAGFKLDKWLMGENHMYHGEGVAFDPEGWLSTLPAISNAVGGFVVGQWIQKKGNSFEGITKLLLAGFALMVCGYFWDLLLPINKKLWTSSYVVYTIGIDCVIIGTLIYIIQIQQKMNWTKFFQVFGKNTLFIYLLSELLVTILFIIPMGNNSNLFRWIYQNIFSYAGGYLGSLLFAIAYMLVCWSIGYWLDKKKIYIKV